jgi:hypothetical protein
MIMKKIVHVVMALMSPLLLHQSFSAQSTATIEGVVLEVGTDRPLEGVRVGLSSRGVTPVAYIPFDSRVPPTLGVTDAEGRFSISSTLFGRFRVVPTLDRFVFSRPGQVRAPAEPGVWVQVNQEQPVPRLELRMVRPAVIRGRVLTSDGQPVVGNAGGVALQRYQYDASGKRFLAWVPGIAYPGAAGSFVRMNDRGEFRLYDVPPGEYYLAISGGGQPIGAARTYYYPGTYDEAKANPVRVLGGEDLDIGTITLPPRQKGAQVTFHLKGESSGRGRRIYVGDVMFINPAVGPDEPTVLPMAPGHYDVIVTNGVISRSEFVFGRAAFDVGDLDIDQEVVVTAGAKVTGSLQVDDNGQRSPAFGIRCRIRSRYGLGECLSSAVVPGPHELELEGTSPDSYVMSATAGDRDIAVEGLNITGDTAVEIILTTPGGIVQGSVRDAAGNALPDAVVVIVPDAPYRSFGPHYRAVISDPNGEFELRGIAPGNYKLFAWTELEGAAYRNAEFMKEYDDKGKPVVIEKGTRISMDVTAF